MPDPIEVQVVALLPMPVGNAAFLSAVHDPDDKVVVVFVDPVVGELIHALLSRQQVPRPTVHHVMRDMLLGLGARMRGACIVKRREDIQGVYETRIVIEMENEIAELKVVELDARPGDALALSIMNHCQFTILSHVWEQMEDVSDQLRSLRQSLQKDNGDENLPEDDDEGDDSPSKDH